MDLVKCDLYTVGMAMVDPVKCNLFTVGTATVGPVKCNLFTLGMTMDPVEQMTCPDLLLLSGFGRGFFWFGAAMDWWTQTQLRFKASWVLADTPRIALVSFMINSHVYTKGPFG